MPGFKFQSSLPSGEKTSSQAILAGPGWVTGITITTDGTNDATAKLYDNASAASGTLIAEHTVVGANHYGGRNWTFPLRAVNGIYLSISGSSAAALVEYIPNV